MPDNNKPVNKNDYRNIAASNKGDINQDRSPYNPNNNLFKRLTKLFSGPIVNRRQQNYKSERRRRLDKYKFQSAQGQQFKKSSYNPFDFVHSQSMANQNRAERYVDFEQMEYTPEIASALDIYADEMTTSNSLEKVLVFESKLQSM